MLAYTSRGFDLRQCLVSQAQPVHDAGAGSSPPTMSADSAMRRNTALPVSERKVQGDAALVAVERQKSAGDVVGQTRPPSAWCRRRCPDVRS